MKLWDPNLSMSCSRRKKAACLLWSWFDITSFLSLWVATSVSHVQCKLWMPTNRVSFGEWCWFSSRPSVSRRPGRVSCIALSLHSSQELCIIISTFCPTRLTETAPCDKRSWSVVQRHRLPACYQQLVVISSSSIGVQVGCLAQA